MGEKEDLMGEIILYEGRSISPDMKTALALMQCTEDNPIYAELCDIYKEQEAKIKSIIHPKGAFTEGKLRVQGENDDLVIGRDVIYSMVTLGSEIVDYIREKSEADMLEGMMVDFMADSALFSFGEELSWEIRKYSEDKGFGIRRGYEPPNLLPMEAQRDAWEILSAEKTLRITMTDGFMLRPIKSNGTIYTISDNPKEFNVKHDCGNCDMKNCPNRHTTR